MLFAVASLAIVSCKNKSNPDAVSTDPKEAVETKEASETANKFNVDTENSVIEWTGTKPGGKHFGTVKLSEGVVFENNGNLTSSYFVIDMNTITVNDLKAGDGKEDLEGHLKGLGDENIDHFFNVRSYPHGRFEITNVTSENNKSTIEGNLTLKGVTKNIKFPAVVTTNDSGVEITTDVFKINRVLWNVNYGSKSVFDDLGNKYINDDIELKIIVKAKK